MPLTTIDGTYLTSKEAAAQLGMAYGTFANNRTARGDEFVQGHPGLIAGRVLFRLEDVLQLAAVRDR